MSKRILQYIILSTSLLYILPLTVSAEDGRAVAQTHTPIASAMEDMDIAYTAPRPASSTSNVKKKLQALIDTIPFYGGTYLGVDIAGVLGSMLGGDTKSIEVQADVNLKNRYFPVLEVGYAEIEAESEHGTLYNSKAPYFRLGLNYKAKYRNRSENHIYLGARYAFSIFNYDVESMEMYDPIWGGHLDPNLSDDIWGGSVPFSLKGVSSSAHWLELVVGIRAEIWKDFLMGWSVRYKQRLSVKEGDMSSPAYIPGFGENKKNTFGITYSLIYKLPL